MAKCQYCTTRRARRKTDVCRFCSRVLRKVQPGRVPTADRARAVLAATVLLLVPAFAVRAWIGILYWRAVGDVWDHPRLAVDEARSGDALVLPDALAVIVAVSVLAIVSWRWWRACYANALTRPELGMSWVTQVHSRPKYRRAQKALAGCYVVLLIAGIGIRSPGTYTWSTLSDIRPLFLVQTGAVLLCLVASVELAVLTRRMTMELITAVEYSEARERRLAAQPAGAGGMRRGASGGGGPVWLPGQRNGS